MYNIIGRLRPRNDFYQNKNGVTKMIQTLDLMCYSFYFMIPSFNYLIR